ncbi:MAG: M81 family metallopeptidase [Deltaproteobacteria bacterium]|nr:M81 family metallopeptidase [Deltaproteobacteria bacterium]
MAKKFFTSVLATETNTFCPFPTAYEDFHSDAAGALTDVVASACAERGYECEVGLVALAEPAGLTTASAWTRLKREFINSLEAAMPVDAVTLCLHGAMVAEDCDDCEGELLAEVRKRVGPDVPIGVGLDAHGHHTQTMTDQTDIQVYFKEWPHTDVAETILKAFELTVRSLEGEIKPRISVFDCRMGTGTYPTQWDPMKSFVDKMRALENEDGILSVSLVHGFCHADVPEMGTKVLVVTNNRQEKGDQLAAKLGREFFSLRDRTGLRYDSIEDGVSKIAKAKELPVVVAETFDIPGGGGPGDSAVFIRALVDAGVTGVAYAYLWDPIAVYVAMRAGEGVTLPMRLGGRIGPLSGDPLDINVTVVRLFQDFSPPSRDGGTCRLGDVAVLQAAGNLIAVSTEREVAIESVHFDHLGIDPGNQRALVVKSANNFYSGYTSVAKDFVFVSGPGVTGNPFETFEYKRVRRPIWPLDDIHQL